MRSTCFSFRGRVMPLDQAVVMGIVNVTPDSFYDGGVNEAPQAALATARRMVSEGASLLDIGGESTRPGASPVDTEEELRRVVPVVTLLHEALPEIPLSVDTTKPEVAEAALSAGASIVNDVSAMERGGEEMLRVVSSFGAGVVLMHSGGVVAEEEPVSAVGRYLVKRMDWACGHSDMCPENFVFDPGIGFGKDEVSDLALLRGCSGLSGYGRPLLYGVSRKSFLGRLTGRKEPGERLAGTLAAESLLLLWGAKILRVHDVAETMDAKTIVERICL